MNDISTERIKKLFYEKLEAEKTVRKPVPYKMILIAAAVMCLATITAFAAQQGAFGALFRNFGDVSGYVQESGIYVNSNGITMQLASYLADDRGIILELVFTRDDGGVFNDTTIPFLLSEAGHFWFGGSVVSLNNFQVSGGIANHLSADGRTLHCFIMAEHFRDFPDVVSLGIYANRLVYGEEMEFLSAEIDFVKIFENSEVIIADNLADIYSDIFSLFDNAPMLETPIVADFGATIDTVIFTSVRADESTLPPPPEWMEWMEIDGIDAAAMNMHDWNNLVGIRYIRHMETDSREFYFNPRMLTGNTDFFGQGRYDDVYSFHFFRVDDFNNLQSISGIDFIVQSRNYLTGEWSIETTFEANRETTLIEPDLIFETANPDVFIALRNVEISLLSTSIAYDVVNAEGRRIHDPQLLSDYFWSGRMPHEAEFKLLYDNGEFIDLSYFWQAGAGVLEDGFITVMYNVQFNDFTTDTFTLMNTNRLQAVVIVGEVFEVTETHGQFPPEPISTDAGIRSPYRIATTLEEVRAIHALQDGTIPITNVDVPEIRNQQAFGIIVTEQCLYEALTVLNEAYAIGFGSITHNLITPWIALGPAFENLTDDDLIARVTHRIYQEAMDMDLFPSATVHRTVEEANIDDEEARRLLDLYDWEFPSIASIREVAKRLFGE